MDSTKMHNKPATCPYISSPFVPHRMSRGHWKNQLRYTTQYASLFYFATLHSCCASSVACGSMYLSGWIPLFKAALRFGWVKVDSDIERIEHTYMSYYFYRLAHWNLFSSLPVSLLLIISLRSVIIFPLLNESLAIWRSYVILSWCFLGVPAQQRLASSNVLLVGLDGKYR